MFSKVCVDRDAALQANKISIINTVSEQLIKTFAQHLTKTTPAPLSPNNTGYARNRSVVYLSIYLLLYFSGARQHLGYMHLEVL